MNPLETNNENEKTRPKKRPTLITMNPSRNKATSTKPRLPSASRSERGAPVMTVEEYLHYLVSRK
jgi:hypothetical protein